MSFGTMGKDQQREIARKGGKAAHAKGAGYEWDSATASAAGQKGRAAKRGQLRCEECGSLRVVRVRTLRQASDDPVAPVISWYVASVWIGNEPPIVVRLQATGEDHFKALARERVANADATVQFGPIGLATCQEPGRES